MAVIEHGMIPPYRLPRKGLGEGWWDMRVDPMFVDIVAYLCQRNRKGLVEAGGTAFFVEVPDEADSSRLWVYAVTAGHCLDEIYGRDVYLRVNLLEPSDSARQYDDMRTDKDQWFRHPKADVAAIFVGDRLPQRHDVKKVPIELFIDDNYRLHPRSFQGRGNPRLETALAAKYPSGIPVELGHDLFFPGLFVQSAGKNRNLPILRFGNIARMPNDELITIKSKSSQTSIRAYLAECHSMGGHSGSPVFWHYEYNLTIPLNVQLFRDPIRASPIIEIPDRQPEPFQRIEVQTNRGYIMGLLGLVSAHFDIDARRNDEHKKTEEETIAQLNAGMVLVTPASDIRELLLGEEMKEDRTRLFVQATQDEPMAVADFVGDVSEQAETQETLAPNPKHRVKMPIPKRGQFMGDLTKATRKTK